MTNHKPTTQSATSKPTASARRVSTPEVHAAAAAAATATLLTAFFSANAKPTTPLDAPHTFPDHISADGDAPRTFNNPTTDSTRPTGSPELDAISPGSPHVRLLTLSIGPWKPLANPSEEQLDSGIAPFIGHYSNTQQPHILRLNMVFQGLVNPPGPLDPPPLGNTGPFAYGSKPLAAVIDIDIDADINTGGSPSNEARHRYAANVARFGALPNIPLAQRSAKSLQDLDYDPHTPPHFERTGEEFSLVLCGCSTPQITILRGNNNSTFEPGEAWVVTGRFFRRSSLLDLIGSVFGGSDIGIYDPLVDLLFDHNIFTNKTTVSLVYPITHTGAAMLLGGPTQPTDLIIGIGGNHYSIEEALFDITTSPPINHNTPLGRSPLRPAVEAWQGRNPADYLNPAQWQIRGVVGTIAQGPLLPAPKLVWTDAIGPHIQRDVTGDGRVDLQDRLAIKQFIAENDGGPRDLDRATTNRVRLDVSSGDFSPYDLTGNGIVSIDDVQRIPNPCPADLSGSGAVEINDYFIFLTAFFANDLLADIDDDLNVTINDYFTFLSAFFAGCQ